MAVLEPHPNGTDDPAFAPDATVVVDDVSVWFGQKVALSELSCSFGPGVTGLLGPNGAGKTTLMRALTGLIPVNQGNVRIEGSDPRRERAVHARMALVPEDEAVPAGLTARQFVRYIADLHQLPDRAAPDDALRTVGMLDAADRRVDTFSKGMRQRTKVAAALVKDPHVLVLDEPLNGADPVQRVNLITLFKDLGAQGRTVIVSSHVLSEVERLAERLIVLMHGRLAAAGIAPFMAVPPGTVTFVIFPLVPPSEAGHTTPHTSAFDQIAGLSLDGIELGLIIAMGALGLSLIFGVTGLVNFAQGELVTFGGLAAWWLSTWGPGPGLPLILSGVLAVAAGGLLGCGLELGMFRPLRRRRTGNVALIVVTIGLSLVLSNLYLIMVGGNPLQYAEYVLQTEVGPGPFTLTPKDWTVVATSIVLILITGFLLQRTRYGTALRAVSDNPDLASSSGIAVERVILITWIGGAALAASGGVFLGIATAVSWDMGLEMLLLLFAAVILGGIGTVYGAVLGALLIGIVTQVSTYWINPEAKNAVAFLVLIGVLLVRPQGILGRRERVG